MRMHSFLGGEAVGNDFFDASVMMSCADVWEWNTKIIKS